MALKPDYGLRLKKDGRDHVWGLEELARRRE